MSIQLLNIGFGNMVSANRVMAIISPESAPIKRMVQDARDKGTNNSHNTVSRYHITKAYIQ